MNFSNPNSKTSQKKAHHKSKSCNCTSNETICTECIHAIDSTHICTHDKDKIIFEIKPNSSHTLSVETLIDNGATQSNYISSDIAKWATAHGARAIVMESKEICPAFGDCQKVGEEIELSCLFINELTKNKESIKIRAKVITGLSHDLIIGRKEIKKNNLACKLPSQFWHRLSELSRDELLEYGNLPDSCFMCIGDKCFKCENQTETLSAIDNPNKLERINPLVDGNDINVPIISEEEFDYQINGKGGVIDDFLMTDPHKKIPLELPPDENHQDDEGMAKPLCKAFGHIFGRTVRPEPANIPPYELKVNDESWKQSKNRRAARLISLAKQYELQRQINKLIANNVITPSQATEWSQVLLVPKPNDKWRLCQDLRSLNESSESNGFPLPNIRDVLRRIGGKQAKYFAVLDLTAGYHQAPMSKFSQSFSAFICFMGLFEWLRVPMGLKGAPSYFQHTITNIVLAGLIYVICEAYLDDIIVYGKSKEEYLTNLRLVFERFEARKLILNPDKCFFSMKEVEYVGHVINEEGCNFSDDKKNEVFDFPTPKIMKDLKKFLGLANYLRDNVKGFSHITGPLNKLIRSYDKYKKLTWTPESRIAFEEIKKAIKESPMKYFIDTISPIFLECDASDYGIGAYLYQVRDGKQYPIEFISHTLSKQQAKWDTAEKEQFAIVYALKKLDHLIGDRFFTLRTDHKNLLSKIDGDNKKVLHWKLMIQAYNFKIEHITGKDNIPADTFSRVECKNPAYALANICEINSNLETINADAFNDTVLLSMRDSNGQLKVIYDIPTEAYTEIESVHNEILGHFGVDLTVQKLLEKGKSWRSMRQHVKTFIRHLCPCCQKMTALRTQIHTHPFTTASLGPMVRLNWDTIGPFPEDKYGNKYIIVIIDSFSRLVELYPCRSTTADEACKALLGQLGRYGCPDEIVSDRGSQYVNEIVDELCKLVGIKQLITVAYSKEENAIVERANKEVQRHLKAILFNRNIINDWSDMLPLVQRIINSKVHESTGVSPAQIIYGNTLNLDRSLFLPRQVLEKLNQEPLIAKPLSQWTDQKLKQQEVIIQIAQQTQLELDQRNMTKRMNEATAKTGINEFPINSYVTMEYRELLHGLEGKRAPNKLLTQLKGPLRVVGKVGNTYTLINLVTNKEVKNIHAKHLQPFTFSPLHVDPRDIANRDLQAWDVKEILAHRNSHNHKTDNNWTRLSHKEFQVRWCEPYEQDTSYWLPWSELRLNVKLHDYLRKIGKANLIPKNIAEEE
jgi:transposase InsO family protein